MNANARQYNATASFHERMAHALEKAGKHADATSAKRAAEMCRQSAKKAGR